ncbi:fructose-bisphosphate aldolase, class II [Micromonospora echinaurantiaca]|uniref:Fructose-bisphosphate aldolase, class II n=1 Tax=Micromonospora echinaurantiaca TaxID=47857 RepID=A0A1C5I2M4_9ACTN|nr:class II fructose-bisphosphate aldolase [Micromonospora echinaurantiaca]SCG52504.1 fructose-bisphosphate aldolase, class II [Micromonospora echinaurantiaca]
MPLSATADLVARAARAGHAACAFNVITLEHAEAVVDAAERVGAPAILQISENAVKYHGGRVLPIARAAAEVARTAAVDVALHLDHVRDEGLLRQAADAGVSSVMYDAAGLPYAANVEATRRAADWAHERGLWIEAELGWIGGKDGEAPLDAHAPGARTDPGQAAAYVAATRVDALAVAVGSRHAMTTRTATLDHALIAKLRGAVDVPLVLHGSSGVSDADLAQAAAGGIVKINIGTALNVAFTTAVRARLADDPRGADPRAYLSLGRTAMAETVEHFLRLLAAPNS